MELKGDKIKKVERVEDGYVVYMLDKIYHLKKVNIKESELLFINEVIEYVNNKGFDNIIKFQRLSNGKPYMKYDGDVYVVIDNYNLIDLKKDINALCYASLLSKFHATAKGFVAKFEIKPSVVWGKRLEKYKNLYRVLEKFIDEVSSKSKHNEFEQLVIPYLDELKSRSKKSMKVLRSISYIDLLETSMKNKEIVLYDIGKNSLAEKDSRHFIYNVFDISYGLIEEDLAVLIKKCNKNLKENIIDIYKENSPRELNIDVLEAYILFPENTLKVIRDYVKQRDLSLIDKFKKASIKDGVR